MVIIIKNSINPTIPTIYQYTNYISHNYWLNPIVIGLIPKFDDIGYTKLYEITQRMVCPTNIPLYKQEDPLAWITKIPLRYN